MSLLILSRRAARMVPAGLSALMLAVGLCFGPVALAGSEQPASAVCQQCHWPEMESWRQSAHARSGVDCENCHGAYVPGHPEQDVMLLSAGAEVCMRCHADTTAEWQNSRHAQYKVACTSCHVSHSQHTRLSAQILCGACHSEQIHSFTHTAHYTGGVTCVDCHASRPYGTSHIGHQFTLIDAKACIGCHAQTIHQQLGATHREAQQQLAALQTASTDLGRRVQTLEKENRSLQGMVVVSLGIGLGLGGLLGIVFVLTILAFVRRGRRP